MVKKTAFFYLPLLALAVFAGSFDTQAQNQRRVIQLSGVVLGADSASFVPGVHVYVPKAGRGTTTNSVGFFSMPVLVGDSIVISSVGYQRQHYIVPNSSKEFQTIIITMVEDVTFLKEVEIVPFPTEEVFKEAVLALNIPTDQQVDQKNLNAELLALMLRTTPMDGPQNQRYSLDQWAAYPNRSYQPVTNPLLNPFNWVKFFNSLKKKK
ncbi:MAG TPA: carboxypeptidase-like regulatory domain-containing protein [Cyclobacteriaceae bacterium]|nr:carboxypeptidase-like regulatory domain-containing protein [Cyclobacteriaceae bacterium]